MDERVQAILDLMDRQRQAAFAALEGLSPAQIWQRPQAGEWSIGEILDHNRKLIASTLTLFKWLWPLKAKDAWKHRALPFEVEIEDPYRKPDFPMGVGWLWTPRHKPVSLAQLRDEMEATHRAVREFYENKDAGQMGSVHFYDPLIGHLNMIQALRVGLYHDQLHFEDVFKQAQALKESVCP